jgi:hypothetical protein
MGIVPTLCGRPGAEELRLLARTKTRRFDLLEADDALSRGRQWLQFGNDLIVRNDGVCFSPSNSYEGGRDDDSFPSFKRFEARAL